MISGLGIPGRDDATHGQRRPAQARISRDTFGKAHSYVADTRLGRILNTRSRRARGGDEGRGRGGASCRAVCTCAECGIPVALDIIATSSARAFA